MRALILGVLGQDGSYLADQLCAEGHHVYGMIRRAHGTSPARLIIGDLLDQDSLERALRESRPDVVYNCAAVTAPGGAWGTPQPPLLADVTAVGVVRLLDAMLKAAPDAHLIHASSSAIYQPRRYGLYGVAKQFAHEAVIGYRNRVRASNAVLFSHTSPRQDPRFLARRICTTVARIATGQADPPLTLGDVEARRDWGYAPDVCDALRLIGARDRDVGSDWVIATGVTHSVRELAEAALAAVGLTWADTVTVDPRAPVQPHEATDHENRRRTTRTLGWRPATTFAEMVNLMVVEALKT